MEEQEEQQLLLCLNFDDVNNPWKDKCGNIFTPVQDKYSNSPKLSGKYYITGRHSYIISNRSYIQCNNLNFDLNKLDNWTMEFWVFIPNEIEDTDLKIFTIKLFDKSIVLSTTLTTMNFEEGKRSIQAVKYEDMLGRFYSRSIVKTPEGISHYWDGYLLSKTIVGSGSSSTVQNLLLKYTKNDMIIGGDSDADIEEGIFCYIDSVKIYGSNNYNNIHYNPSFFQYTFLNSKRDILSNKSYSMNTKFRNVINIEKSYNTKRNIKKIIFENNNTSRNIHYNLSEKEKYSNTLFHYNIDNYYNIANSIRNIIKSNIFLYNNIRNITKNFTYLFNNSRNVYYTYIINNNSYRNINKNILVYMNLKTINTININNYNNTKAYYNINENKNFNNIRNITANFKILSLSIRFILNNNIKKHITKRIINFIIDKLKLNIVRNIDKNIESNNNTKCYFNNTYNNLIFNTKRKINFTYYNLIYGDPLYNSAKDNKPKFNLKRLINKNIFCNNNINRNVVFAYPLQFNISCYISKNIITRYNTRYNCGKDLIPVLAYTNTQRLISYIHEINFNLKRSVLKNISPYTNTENSQTQDFKNIYLSTIRNVLLTYNNNIHPLKFNTLYNNIKNIIAQSSTKRNIIFKYNILCPLKFNISRYISKNIITRHNTRYNCGKDLIPIMAYTNTQRLIKYTYSHENIINRLIIKNTSLKLNIIRNIYTYTLLYNNTLYNDIKNTVIQSSTKRNIIFKYNDSYPLKFNISRHISKNIITRHNTRYNCGKDLIPIMVYTNIQRLIKYTYSHENILSRFIIENVLLQNNTARNNINNIVIKFIIKRNIIFKYNSIVPLKFNTLYNDIKNTVIQSSIKRNIIFKYNDSCLLKFNISRYISKNIITRYNTRYNCGKDLIPILACTNIQRLIKYTYSHENIINRFINKNVLLQNNTARNNIKDIVLKANAKCYIIFKYNSIIPLKFNTLYNHMKNVTIKASIKRNIIFKYNDSYPLKFNISRHISKNIITRHNTRYNCGKNLIPILAYTNIQRLIKYTYSHENILSRFINKNVYLYNHTLYNYVKYVINKFNIKRNIIFKYNSIVPLKFNTLYNHMKNVIIKASIKRNIIFKYNDSYPLKFNISRYISKNIITRHNTRYNCGKNLIPILAYTNTQRLIKYTYSHENILSRFINKNVYLYNHTLYNYIKNTVIQSSIKRNIIFKYNDSYPLKFNISRYISKNIIIRHNTRYNCGKDLIPILAYTNTQRLIKYTYSHENIINRFINKNIYLYNHTLYNYMKNIVIRINAKRNIIFKDYNILVKNNIQRIINKKFIIYYNLKLLYGIKEIITYTNTICKTLIYIIKNNIQTYRKIYYKKDFKFKIRRFIYINNPLYNRDYNMDRRVVAFVVNPDYTLRAEFINVPYLPHN